MPYASLDDLISAFGERELIALTDRGAEATGVMDEAVIDGALGAADALIDGYVAGRYALPMSPVPPLITELAVPLALYKLHRFGRPDQVEADYKDARATLRDISEGRVKLPVSGVQAAQTDAGQAQTTDRDRPFEAKKMTGFI